MNRNIGLLGIVIIFFAIIGLAIGIAFLQQGYSKQAWMLDAMRQEKISLASLGIKSDIAQGIIDSPEKAQLAADKVRADRHSIAPSYGELMGTGKYDPANPTHLLYAQALNIENYLYLAILGFGVITIALAAGGYMVISSLALGAIGFVLIKISRSH